MRGLQIQQANYTARFPWEGVTSPLTSLRLESRYLHFHKPCALHNREPASPLPGTTKWSTPVPPNPRQGRDRAKERGGRDKIHEGVCGDWTGSHKPPNKSICSICQHNMGRRSKSIQVHDTSICAQGPDHDRPRPCSPLEHSREPDAGGRSSATSGGSLGSPCWRRGGFSQSVTALLQSLFSR